MRGNFGPGVLRVLVGLALMGSGALMYAASWQRWAGACPWINDPDTRACDVRMSDLYDFVPPYEPWEPAGVAPELAGVSLLVFALALVALPWAIAGRRPSLGPVLTLPVCVLVATDTGIAIVRSGLADAVVEPVFGDVTMWLWLLALPLLLFWLALSSRGWTTAAAVSLILASPLVATFTYAIGSFDARPWNEAISGGFIFIAGACLLVAAARRSVSAGESPVMSAAR